MQALGNNLLTLIVLLVVGIIAYVVIVGGVLCIVQDRYTYSAYLEDLSRLQPILIAALVGAIGRELVPLLQRRNNHKGAA